MFEVIIATICSLLSVFICYKLWKKEHKNPVSRYLMVTLLLPLPIWIGTAGAEFGTTYYLIAFSLSGLLLTLFGREIKKGRLRIKNSNKEDKEIVKRRAKKLASFSFALVLPTISSFLLLMSLPHFTTELTADLIVSSIFSMLLIWPVLMIWQLTSRSLLAPVITMSALSILAAVPLIL